MQTTSIFRRWAAVVAIAATMLGAGFSTSLRSETFPPLNKPASREAHPGKFTWAELFTTDAAAATKFYTGVFGWTAITVNQYDVAYTVFSNGNHPVAGLRQRSASAAKRASRWICYIAVSDIAASLSTAVRAGADVRAPAREFPQIGTLAIVSALYFAKDTDFIAYFTRGLSMALFAMAIGLAAWWSLKARRREVDRT